MLGIQRPNPPGHIDVQLLHGEGVEQILQNSADVLHLHGLAICNHHRHTIGAADILGGFLGRSGLRPGGVENHHKGLPGGLHIPDGPALCFHIILSGDVRDGAVGGDHKADGAVLLHDLFGAQLSGLGHGDFIVKPGGGDHPGHPILLGAHSPFHHVAHGVNHPNPQFGGAVRGDFHPVFRHELGLTGHNGFPGAALGQLIPGPFRFIGVIDVGNHQLFHNPLDEGGFSGTHRAYHANVDIASGSGGNIGVDVFHSQPPCSGRRPAPATVYQRVCPRREK